jgi:hypothetical protein
MRWGVKTFCSTRSQYRMFQQSLNRHENCNVSYLRNVIRVKNQLKSVSVRFSSLLLHSTSVTLVSEQIHVFQALLLNKFLYTCSTFLQQLLEHPVFPWFYLFFALSWMWHLLPFSPNTLVSLLLDLHYKMRNSRPLQNSVDLKPSRPLLSTCHL